MNEREEMFMEMLARHSFVSDDNAVKTFSWLLEDVYQAGRQSMHKDVLVLWEVSASELQFDNDLREIGNE